MPLVHEFKFGAINQLSGIYLYKCLKSLQHLIHLNQNNLL